MPKATLSTCISPSGSSLPPPVPPPLPATSESIHDSQPDVATPRAKARETEAGPPRRRGHQSRGDRDRGSTPRGPASPHPGFGSSTFWLWSLRIWPPVPRPNSTDLRQRWVGWRGSYAEGRSRDGAASIFFSEVRKRSFRPGRRFSGQSSRCPAPACSPSSLAAVVEAVQGAVVGDEVRGAPVSSSSTLSIPVPVPAASTSAQANVQIQPTPLARAAIKACTGAAVGTFTYMALLPLDAVKTRLQAGAASRGSWQVLSDILRTDGPLGLYRGLSAFILGSATSSAIYFGTYELAKSLLRPHLPPLLVPPLAGASGNMGLSRGIGPRVVHSACFAAIGYCSFETARLAIERGDEAPTLASLTTGAEACDVWIRPAARMSRWRREMHAAGESR